MRKLIILVILGVILVSSISAEIIFTVQPNSVYNLGEIIKAPLTIKTTQDVTGVLDVNLICGGKEVNFFRNGVTLSAGAEQKFDTSLILRKSFIGDLEGSCLIKAVIDNEYALTNNFKISSSINSQEVFSAQEISPGEPLVITGTATKESGASVEGFVQAEIKAPNSTNIDPALLSQIATVNNGAFTISLTTQKNMPAGEYGLTLTIYERDSSNEVTNQEIKELSFTVKQVPTNIEIILDNRTVNPSAQVKISPILYDQSGLYISSPIDIEIKNSKGKIVEKTQIESGENTNFLINSNEPPSTFTITATYGSIQKQATFDINPKADIRIQTENETVTLTNIGNVPYCNKTILVRIGNNPLNLNPCLQVDEVQKYSLSAPNGEYPIEIIADNQKISGSAVLTGSAINIKEISNSVLSRKPFIWIFVVLIFGLMAFTVYKKGYKRSLVGGYVEIKRKSPPSSSSSLSSKPLAQKSNQSQQSFSQQRQQTKETPSRMALSSLEYTPKFYQQPMQKSEPTKSIPNQLPSRVRKISANESLMENVITSNISKAQLSLSIQGQSQTACVVCLKVRNYNEWKANSGVQETLSKAIEAGKSAKAIVYENQENTFFILAPVKTRSLKNDKDGITLAQKVKDILNYHNRIQRQKMNFGLSVSTGNLIIKLNRDIFEFAPLGDTMTKARRLASIANENVLLDEKLRALLAGEIKTERVVGEGIVGHSITEVRDREEHEKFLKRFTERNR
ncbi:MAG: hypothetical protein AABW63_00280 [Nanoarchaeota archaeon]